MSTQIPPNSQPIKPSFDPFQPNNRVVKWRSGPNPAATSCPQPPIGTLNLRFSGQFTLNAHHIPKGPKHVRTVIWKGKYPQENGNTAGAIAFLEQLLKEKPELKDWLFNK